MFSSGRALNSSPRDFKAVLQALRFDVDATGLAALDEAAWNRVLALCDREHLTLPLYQMHANALPDAIAQRMQERLARNEERVRRVRNTYNEIAAAFSHSRIEWAVLKGFTQYPGFVADLRYRVQYDLDFFCPEQSVYRAREVLQTLGYEPLQEMQGFPTDHLPVMIRKTGWQWRGDFFDPDIPVSVDLHFRFWDANTEGFDAPGVDQFWPRAESYALHHVDALGYHCLHLIRHLLRSSLRLSHVYELAWFLERRARDEAFWHEWQALHCDKLRGLQAIAFRLAQIWFDCPIALQARQQVERLPCEVDRWFAYYAWAPIEGLFRPNKHELWLHLALLESGSAKRRVIRRRLLPARLPGPVDSVYVPDVEITPWLRVRRKVRYASHLAARAIHHAQALPSVLWHGALWRSRSVGLTADFWTFIGTASLFNFGQFVFVLTYNLYLLDRGYRESFLGLVNGAFTAGTVAGALPAGAILQRLGVRSGFQLCVLGMAVMSAIRTLGGGEVPLIGSAFVGGLFFSLLAVIIAPAIALLTTEKTRPRGFSYFFAISIAVGMLGGLIGGRLPAWLGTKQAALLCGCAITLVALWPASRLVFGDQPRAARLRYPLGSFVRRFLLALVGWNLAVGAFNPFFNTFFAQHLNARMEQIGIVFSTAQLAQVAAMMAAPVVLKRLGLVNGVMSTQIAAGVALAALALSQGVFFAGAAYAGYAAFQYMSEPGVYTLLMSRVRSEEQSGASSLNFLVAFGAQAISATVAGAALSRYGYAQVIPVIALIAILSAFLFRVLLREFEAGAQHRSDSAPL